MSVAFHGVSCTRILPFDAPRPKTHAVKANPLHTICPPPFEASTGICLSFHDKFVTWLQAEDFCNSRGGHLAWMQSRVEHNVIRSFVLNKGRVSHVWIGLHRLRNDSVAWSSGMRSNYRGSPFTKQNLAFVSMDARDRHFDGDDRATRLPFVCRRRLDTDGQMNVVMLLESNRVESDDRMNMVAKYILNKMLPSIDRLAIAINREHVQWFLRRCRCEFEENYKYYFFHP